MVYAIGLPVQRIDGQCAGAGGNHQLFSAVCGIVAFEKEAARYKERGLTMGLCPKPLGGYWKSGYTGIVTREFPVVNLRTGRVFSMLHPGLYEQVINDALNQELASVPDARKFAAPIDRAETAKVLAQYLAEVSIKGPGQCLGQWRGYRRAGGSCEPNCPSHRI